MLANDVSRAGKPAYDVVYMASRRLFQAGAIQRRFQSRDARHQSEDSGPTRKDGFVFPVGYFLLEVKKTLLTITSPEDSEIEVANMREGVGKMIAFPSICGHS